MMSKQEEKQKRRQQRAYEDVKKLVSSKTLTFLENMEARRHKFYYTDVRRYIENGGSHHCPVCGTDWDYILSVHTCYFCKPQYEDDPNLTPFDFVPTDFRVKVGEGAWYYNSDGKYEYYSITKETT